jgi:hypothetical protein
VQCLGGGESAGKLEGGLSVYPVTIVTKPRSPTMLRSWQAVSEAMQKLAVGLHDVKSEGMFPYETHYVLATDEEVGRLYDLGKSVG